MRRQFAFVPSILLALSLIGSKLAIVWPMGSVQAAKDWIAISAEDVFVALAFGAIAAAALRVAKDRTRMTRVVWIGIVTAGAIGVAYSIAGVGIFQSLRAPLNVRMLSLVGQVSNFRSSFQAQCSYSMLGFAHPSDAK